MQVSKKQKTFSEFFSAVLKSRLNIENFQKRITLLADAVPELRTCFRRSIHKQHDKRSERLLKSTRLYLYHVY